METGYPRYGDGDLLCLAQFLGASYSMAIHGLIGINLFEVVVVAAVEVHDAGHDLAQRQGCLASPLGLATLQQPLRVERLNPLQKSSISQNMAMSWLIGTSVRCGLHLGGYSHHTFGLPPSL
jgi:hypothetical protein